jgi:long-subunit fatty acid transport protein
MRNTYIIILILVCTVFPIAAQSSDFGLWTDYTLSKKVTSNLDLALEVDLRLRNELRTIDKIQTTLEGDYKINDFFKAGLSYTYINNYRKGNKAHDYKNYWETRHRFNVIGEGEYDLGRFNFSLRERAQFTYRMLDSVTTAKLNPKWVLRSKLSIAYNIPKIPVEPYLNAELFHLMNGEKSMDMEEYRIGAGIKYKYSKKLSFKVGYIYSNEYNDDDSEIIKAVTAGISYKL